MYSKLQIGAWRRPAVGPTGHVTNAQPSRRGALSGKLKYPPRLPVLQNADATTRSRELKRTTVPLRFVLLHVTAEPTPLFPSRA